jgi:uncharacterized protein YdeI (YjbR/CyaY-like superfamily)
MNKMNPKVDFYFKKAKHWQKELEQLRRIVLGCKLTEELKWGVPCYTYGESNIVLIHVFKEYCAILFVKGALLKDKEGVLVQQTKNVQSARQIRFANVEEVIELEPVIIAYIKELVFPEELQIRLDEDPDLKTAFEALTPGRQRGYHLYFSAAKQSKTRESRVEKYVPQILKGKGLDD